MKAVRLHHDGGPEVLRYEDVADPTAGRGEIVIRLAAASLNHLDVWIRMGMPSVPKPRVLGADGAGVVESLGAGAESADLRPGDRVVINPGLDDGRQIVGEHRDGTHAEFVTIPAEYVHRLPDTIGFVDAAAFPLVFEMAYRMLVTRAALQAGEWVLVWGVASGVGSGHWSSRRRWERRRSSLPDTTTSSSAPVSSELMRGSTTDPVTSHQP